MSPELPAAPRFQVLLRSEETGGHGSLIEIAAGAGFAGSPIADPWTGVAR